MQTFSTWTVDTSQILTRGELTRVLAGLTTRAPRLANVRLNLVIVRLACCCGLRAREIGGLSLDDVRVGIQRPHLQVRGEFAKLGRSRRVPLWWDAGTLEDLSAWKAFRQRRMLKVTILWSVRYSELHSATGSTDDMRAEVRPVKQRPQVLDNQEQFSSLIVRSGCELVL
jgi:integrase